MSIFPEIHGAANNRELLNESLSLFAEGIREHSRDQVENWRQLPYLALQAEGNGGYSSFSQKLYEHGLLHIRGEAEGLFGTFIDCDNGNILSLKGKVKTDSLAPDPEVVSAWLPDGQKFASHQWLAQYRLSAVQPHRSFGTPEQEVRDWRHATAKRLGLLSMYSRTSAES